MRIFSATWFTRSVSGSFGGSASGFQGHCSDAARQFNYSDAYFCKLFKQCFDQNFTTYLTNFRINEAKRLLKDRNISVKDAGMKVGYYDSNYFAKVFKRVTGMIPSEYREAN